MKEGYHIEVQQVFHRNATSTHYTRLFVTKPIKDKNLAFAVFRQLSYHYPEPDFEVSCTYIEYRVTIKDLEDF